MLNSLSNNPGNGNQDGLNGNVQSQEEPIIQEVYEPEPDDYNYQPQYREVDEEELRNLSAIREETETDTRVYKASALFLIMALIGAGIGFAMASSAAGKADVARKTSMARTIKSVLESKLEGFDKLDKSFAAVEGGKFDLAKFNDELATYGKNNFILDMSSEVTSEAVLLAGDNRANPLKGLRQYSADSMLLMQLLSNHVNETRADAEAIAEIQASKAKEVTYAMQVIPEAVYNLGTDAPRTQYANVVTAIYNYKDVIEDDAKAATVYENLKIDNKWSEEQRLRRDYAPEGKKGSEDQAILPNRLIYQVTDRSGKESLLFADDIILVDRKLLFGKSLNALERYEARTALIKSVIEDARDASKTIISDLDKFIIE
jgi:hypothetical protein